MKKTLKGFTLIELLVVVAIIALIGSFLIVSISSSRAKGHDTKRISDLQSLQTALELYKSNYGSYPKTESAQGECWLTGQNTTITAGAGCAGDTTSWTAFETKLKPYLQGQPHDGIEGQQTKRGGTTYTFRYCYQSDGTDYKLQALLEKNDDAMANDGAPDNNHYEIYTSGARSWN